jgi:putative spermidine/putrescine transport system permease protein
MTQSRETPLEILESDADQLLIKPEGPLRVTRKRRSGFWGSFIFYLIIGFFILNLLGIVGTVVIDSFGQEWFNTWLPNGFTTDWYVYLTGDHDIGSLIFNTLFIAILTTLLALLLGFPAAYVLARKKFPGKSVLSVVYILPLLFPPLVYGIPLATVLLRYLGGGLFSVVLINLVPILPFAILILVPFIEQVDDSLESASRMLGAKRWQTFVRIVLPLIIPGLLTAGVLSIVRTIAQFELTFLLADATAQTMVVTLYGDAFGAGIRPAQAIDAMAVIYTATTMILLGIALIFVKPTQFVTQLKRN